MLIYNCGDRFSNINPRKTKKISPGNEKMLPEQRKVVISKSHTITIQMKAQGMEFISEADESTSGPASFIVVDPDGNPILVDQHI